MSSGVIATLHNPEADRYVKIVKGDEGRFSFKEYRKDPEDAGGWTVVSDPRAQYATDEEALAAAERGIPWFRDMRTAKTGAR